MAPTRPLNAAVKAEVTADYNGLPHGRITEHDGAAYVFTDRLTDLERWFLALGGQIGHEPAGEGLTLWSLNTLTERTHGAPVRVRALALDTDQIDPECADAVTPALQQNSGTRPGSTDANGFCTTCGGHGTLTTDGEEIPYEDLSPRRKQGHDLGHRFYRNTSKPCPHCDGQDRVTDAAVSAHEASL